MVNLEAIVGWIPPVIQQGVILEETITLSGIHIESAGGYVDHFGPQGLETPTAPETLIHPLDPFGPF